MQMSRLKPKSYLCLFLALSLGFFQHSVLKETVQQSRYSSLEVIKAEEAEDARLLMIRNIPAFGFRNTVADWTFLSFLLYFGDDQARDLNGYSKAPRFFESIIHHDPHYRDFYIFLSGSVTAYAGLPERTVEIMDEGLEKLSPNQPHDGYYIWRYKAADELLFLGKGKDAQKSYELAAEWATQSEDAESDLIGKLSSRTAQFLKDDPDSKFAQINAWNSILTTAIDDTTRKKAISKIRELGGDVTITENGQIQISYAKSEGLDDRDKPDI